jgi:hypothetical protein
MRLTLAVTLMALLVGCGEDRDPTLLKAGTYEVDGIYLLDTWPGGEPGREFTVDVELSVTKGEDPTVDVYRMAVVGSSTEGPGVVGDDGNIYFLIEHWEPRCGLWSQIFDAVYEPTSRTTFGGHSATLVTLCNISPDDECSCGSVFFSSALDGKRK